MPVSQNRGVDMASQEPQREEPVLEEPSRRRLHLREVRSEATEYDGIGAEMRAARVREGVELDDVAQKLRIGRNYLEALELGRFDELPGDVYVFGFLRSYARFLNLDENIAIERYRSESAGPRSDTRLEFPSAMDRGRMPTGRLLLAGLVVAIVAYAGWFVLTSEERSTADRVSPVPDRLAAETETPATAAPRTPEIAVSSAAAGVRPETAVEGAAEPASTPTPAVPVDPVEVEAAAPVATPPVVAAVPVRDTPAVEPTVSLPRAETPAVEAAEPAGPVANPPVAAAVETPLTERTPNQVETRVAAVVEEATPTVVVEESESAAEVVAAEPPVATPERTAPVVEAAAAVAETNQPTTSAADTPASAEPDNAARLSQIAEASSAPIQNPVAETATVPAPEPAAAPSEPDARETEVAALPPAEAPPPLARTGEPETQAAPSGYVPRVFGAGNEDARVVIIAVSDSWVQVRATTGELLLTRVLRPGDRYLVPDRSGLVMMTGNVGALRVEVDGSAIPTLGPLGVIGRDIPLDADRLLSGDVVVREDVSP